MAVWYDQCCGVFLCIHVAHTKTWETVHSLQQHSEGDAQSADSNPINLALLECDLQLARQKEFINQKKKIIITNQPHLDSSPLEFAMSLDQRVGSSWANAWPKLWIIKATSLQETRPGWASESTNQRLQELNPYLTLHTMYGGDASVALVSSHKTGCWSHIPWEERLCPSGSDIQTDPHVLIKCLVT